MASTIEQSPFFQQKRAKGEIIVTGTAVSFTLTKLG
jgi:hypothetical protein